MTKGRKDSLRLSAALVVSRAVLELYRYRYIYFAVCAAVICGNVYFGLFPLMGHLVVDSHINGTVFVYTFAWIILLLELLVGSYLFVEFWSFAQSDSLRQRKENVTPDERVLHESFVYIIRLRALGLLRDLSAYSAIGIGVILGLFYAGFPHWQLLWLLSAPLLSAFASGMFAFLLWNLEEVISYETFNSKPPGYTTGSEVTHIERTDVNGEKYYLH